MPHTKKHGSLEVICGPMFSGKSEELIRRLRRATIAKQNVAVFKHSLDDRHTIEHIISHNGNKINAYATDRVEDLARYGQTEKVDVIGIDEVQFFSSDIITVICQLIENKKRVLVAGLDRNFRGEPFGPLPTLLAIADSVTKLCAICTICGAEAQFTQRLVNNRPAKYNDPIILVGAEESYDARCRTCYQIDQTPLADAWQESV